MYSSLMQILNNCGGGCLEDGAEDSESALRLIRVRGIISDWYVYLE